MSKTKKALLVFCTIVLILFCIPLFGFIYKFIYESISGSPFGGCGMTMFCFKHPEYFEGFFVSCSFFITLAITIFGGRKKYWTLAALLVIIFLIQVGVPESLIVSAGAALIAWLIAQAILLIKRKINKK
jgi:hypothetical protein